MSYQVTQEDLDILRQGMQEITVKVDLLDTNYKILDSLEGNVITDSISQDNESVQRRSYSCTLQITHSSFSIGKDKKIWYDKRIRPYYGVKSLRTGNIKYYLLGTFTYDSINSQYDPVTNQLQLTCPDLMSLYDGTLNGQIGGYGSSNPDSDAIAQGLFIPAGEDIRKSIIATLKASGITQYIVEDIGKEIPYDLEFDTGTTFCDVWTKIRDLYDSWEFYFDINGVFIWQQVPTCLDDPVALDDDIMQQITVDENVNIKLSGIYNVTEVFGKVLELTNNDRYAETSTYTDNVYHITLDGYKEWSDVNNLTKIGLKVLTDNLDSPKFSINNYSPIPIYDGDGKPLKAGVLKSNNSYVFRFRRQTVTESGLVMGLFLLGQYQCYGKYVESSPKCPYSTVNIGEIGKSVQYDSLTDDAACYNQAEYLTYKTTAMMDTINLTTQVIPWLEVNQKVSYKSKLSHELNQYIVKSLNWTTGDGTMSLVLYKFLEDFSFVYDRKHKKRRDI